MCTTFHLHMVFSVDLRVVPCFTRSAAFLLNILLTMFDDSDSHTCLSSLTIKYTSERITENGELSQWTWGKNTHKKMSKSGVERSGRGWTGVRAKVRLDECRSGWRSTSIINLLHVLLMSWPELIQRWTSGLQSLGLLVQTVWFDGVLSIYSLIWCIWLSIYISNLYVRK